MERLLGRTSMSEADKPEARYAAYKVKEDDH